MNFSIYKMPTKVSLSGFAGLGLYFAVGTLLLRNNEYFYMMIGGGLTGMAMLFIKSIGARFISAFTVTENSIETVTPVGGIIKINFSDIDFDRTNLSEMGL